MATQVIMPKLSPTMEEGQLSRWLKKEGDKVSMGEPLAEIDTDKATMEMQALANGVSRKIIIKEGESAPLGQLIAIIGEPDEDISAMLASSGGGAEPKAAAAQPAAKQEQPTTPSPAEEPAAPPKPAGPPAKAAAAALSQKPQPPTLPPNKNSRQLHRPLKSRPRRQSLPGPLLKQRLLRVMVPHQRRPLRH